VSSGTPLGSPSRKTSAPARCSSHTIGAPVASMIRRAAVTTSGPMPSPGISVTGVVLCAALTASLSLACRGSVMIATTPMVAVARSRVVQVRLVPSGAVPIPQRTKRALFAVLVVAALAIGVVAIRVIPDNDTAASSPAPSAAVITVSDADAAPVDPKLGIDNIKHFIFVVQENRSFDSYFGTFPGANGIPRNPDGTFSVCVKDDQGTCWKPYHDTGQADQRRPHNQGASGHDINGGAMDGFVTALDRVKACTKGQMSQECTYAQA